MPNFIALGCLEVGEKFSVGGVGAFRHQLQCYTNLKLGWVVVRLGCNKNSNVNNNNVLQFKLNFTRK